MPDVLVIWYSKHTRKFYFEDQVSGQIFEARMAEVELDESVQLTQVASFTNEELEALQGPSVCLD